MCRKFVVSFFCSALNHCGFKELLSTFHSLIDTCKIQTKCPYFIFPFTNERRSDGVVVCVSVHSIELLTAATATAAVVDVNVIFSLGVALYLRLTILGRHISFSLSLFVLCNKSTSIIYRSLHLLCIFYSLFSFSDSFYGNVWECSSLYYVFDESESECMYCTEGYGRYCCINVLFASEDVFSFRK